MYFVVNSCDGRRRILTFTTHSGQYSGDQIRYVEVAMKVVDLVVAQRKHVVIRIKGVLQDEGCPQNQSSRAVK